MAISAFAKAWVANAPPPSTNMHHRHRGGAALLERRSLLFGIAMLLQAKVVVPRAGSTRPDRGVVGRGTWHCDSLP